MNLFRRVNHALQGAPDQVLTLVLLGVAAAAVGLAFGAPPALKAAAAAWFIFP